MGFIQIDKKAVTSDDAKRLVDQTCALPNALGANIRFLRPEEFSQSYNKTSANRLMDPSELSLMKEDIEAIVKPHTNFALSGSGKKAELQRNVIGNLTGSLKKLLEGDNGFAAFETHLAHNDYSNYAHYFTPADYIAPLLSFIITPKATMSANVDIYHNSIQKDLDMTLPGSKEQWQFYALWHEIAHTAGADRQCILRIAPIAFLLLPRREWQAREAPRFLLIHLHRTR